ncbi:MAG: isocitrate lyase/phosphoenolpyruvate mutase family protein [Crocinitomicaceae bacterium]|nr:isocitrate lyase/phosphoenolpyruvate mutase family protein [Crocinitomicaceae bacterium]
MNTRHTQAEKAQQFMKLHHTGKLLILPNIWDVLGAKLLEDVGYQAIATASAPVAFTNGYEDGEKIPLDRVIENLHRITNSVNLPVTADIECAYADEGKLLEKNIQRILETGIAGLNFEDSDKTTGDLIDISKQCNRIKTIRKIADEMEIPLFINARTDVLFYSHFFSTPEEQQAELLRRGQAYKDAGADCYFPVALKDADMIGKIVSTIKIPVNIIALPGIPGFDILEKLGVSRVSLGPSFLKIAIQSMRTLALSLLKKEGLPSITENEITTDYIKSLIKSV